MPSPGANPRDLQDALNWVIVDTSASYQSHIVIGGETVTFNLKQFQGDSSILDINRNTGKTINRFAYVGVSNGFSCLGKLGGPDLHWGTYGDIVRDRAISAHRAFSADTKRALQFFFSDADVNALANTFDRFSAFEGYQGMAGEERLILSFWDNKFHIADNNRYYIYNYNLRDDLYSTPKDFSSPIDQISWADPQYGKYRAAAHIYEIIRNGHFGCYDSNDFQRIISTVLNPNTGVSWSDLKAFLTKVYGGWRPGGSSLPSPSPSPVLPGGSVAQTRPSAPASPTGQAIAHTEYVPFSQWSQKALKELSSEQFYLQDQKQKAQARGGHYWIDSASTGLDKIERDLKNVNSLVQLFEFEQISGGQDYVRNVLTQVVNQKESDSQQNRDLLSSVIRPRAHDAGIDGSLNDINCLLFESNLALNKGLQGVFNSKSSTGCANPVVSALLSEFRDRKELAASAGGIQVPYSDADFANILLAEARSDQSEFQSTIPIKTSVVTATAYGNLEMLAVANDIYSRLVSRYGAAQSSLVAQTNMDDDIRQGLHLTSSCYAEKGSILNIFKFTQIPYSVSYDKTIPTQGGPAPAGTQTETTPSSVAHFEAYQYQMAPGNLRISVPLSARLSYQCLWDPNYVLTNDPESPIFKERQQLTDVLRVIRSKAGNSDGWKTTFIQDMNQGNFQKYGLENIKTLSEITGLNFIRLSTVLRAEPHVLASIFSGNLARIHDYEQEINDVLYKEKQTALSGISASSSPFTSAPTDRNKYLLAWAAQQTFLNEYGKVIKLSNLLSTAAGQGSVAKTCAVGVITSLADPTTLGFMVATGAGHLVLSSVGTAFPAARGVTTVLGGVADITLAVYFTYHATDLLLEDYSKMDLNGQVQNTCAVGVMYVMGGPGIFHGGKTVLDGVRAKQKAIGDARDPPEIAPGEKPADPVTDTLSDVPNELDAIKKVEAEQPSAPDPAVQSAISKSGVQEPAQKGGVEIKKGADAEAQAAAFKAAKAEKRTELGDRLSKVDSESKISFEGLSKGAKGVEEAKLKIFESIQSTLTDLGQHLGWYRQSTSATMSSFLKSLADRTVEAFARDSAGNPNPQKLAQISVLMKKATILLAYADHMSAGQIFSDHSIFHFKEDFDKFENGYPGATPRELVLGGFTAILHDLGYTIDKVDDNPLAFKIAGRHPIYSRALLESRVRSGNILGDLEAVFESQADIDNFLYAVGSHGSKEGLPNGAGNPANIKIKDLYYGVDQLKNPQMRWVSLFALADDLASLKVPELAQLLVKQLLELRRLPKDQQDIVTGPKGGKGEPGTTRTDSQAANKIRDDMRQTIDEHQSQYTPQTVKQLLVGANNLGSGNFDVLVSPAAIKGTGFRFTGDHVEVTIEISKPFVDVLGKFGIEQAGIYKQVAKVGKDVLVRSDRNKVVDSEGKVDPVKLKTQEDLMEKTVLAQLNGLQNGDVVLESNGNKVIFKLSNDVAPEYQQLYNTLNGLPASSSIGSVPIGVTTNAGVPSR